MKSTIIDSYQIWLAAMGSGVATLGVATLGGQKNGPLLYQNQIAATLAKLLGLTFTTDHPVGPPIETIIRR